MNNRAMFTISVQLNAQHQHQQPPKQLKALKGNDSICETKSHLQHKIYRKKYFFDIFSQLMIILTF